MGWVYIPLYARVADPEAVRVHERSRQVDIVHLVIRLCVVHLVEPRRHGKHVWVSARPNLRLGPTDGSVQSIHRHFEKGIRGVYLLELEELFVFFRETWMQELMRLRRTRDVRAGRHRLRDSSSRIHASRLSTPWLRHHPRHCESRRSPCAG